MDLTIIRHGQSGGDVENRIEGTGTYDPPLTELGRRQAQSLAQWLCEDRYQFDRLLSSPVLRARQVAEIIAGELGLRPEFYQELREIETGAVCGLTPQQAKQVRPEPAGGWRVYDRFPEGECALDLYRRVSEFYLRLLDASRGHRLCLVTHGGTITMLLNVIYGLPLNHPRSPLYRFPTYDTGVHRLEITSSGVCTRFLNSTEHLVRDGLKQPVRPGTA